MGMEATKTAREEVEDQVREDEKAEREGSAESDDIKESKTITRPQRHIAMEVVKFFDGDEEDFNAFMEAKGYTVIS